MNLGCGAKKLDGYVNVDSRLSTKPDWDVDLAAEHWPWNENSVDEVIASHLLEHIPRGEPFFHFMRELYRVCKPGAKVHVTLPHPSHDNFLNDPTHVQAVMPGTLALFSKRHVEKAPGVTPFYKELGVDFDFETVSYEFDPSVHQDEQLAWKAMHLRNVIMNWSTTLTVIK